MFMNISDCFPYPYEYVYFTCSYLGRIFLDVDVLHIEKLKLKKHLLRETSIFSADIYALDLITKSMNPKHICHSSN